jgi:GMP synthase-like glutamine amidotransferase
MKIGIIVCDTVEPILSAEYGEFADMIMATLSPHGEFEYELFDAVAGVLPAKDDQCQGYIITGSTHDSYADIPWLHQLAEWIRHCDQQKKLLAGICFGHQIIALALGGKVEKSHKGWGLGISRNTLHQRPDWMNSDKDILQLLVSHQDQVIQLPPSVEVIASSDFCPYFMLSKDNHILTVQGHPEFSVEFEKQLLVRKKTLISEKAYQTAIDSLALSLDSSDIMKWFATFFLLNAVSDAT